MTKLTRYFSMAPFRFSTPLTTGTPSSREPKPISLVVEGAHRTDGFLPLQLLKHDLAGPACADDHCVYRCTFPVFATLTFSKRSSR